MKEYERQEGCIFGLMGLRKLSAELIFDGYRFHRESVLVVDESGKVVSLMPAPEAGEGVEQFTGLLTPGFINCHCHLELSHMKGRIPEKTGLVDFVFKVVTERHHSEQEILGAIEKGESEMYSNGIVAVGDICNNALTLSQKRNQRLLYYNFIESSGWLPSVSDARFARALELYEAYSQLDDSLCSIVPHAPYSVSAPLWKAIQPYFRSRTVSIHNQETAFEDEFFKTGSGDFKRMYELMKIDNSHHQPTGHTSLRSYFPQLQDASRILLVHNSFTTKPDLRLVQSSTARDKVFFCLCPNANLYIEDVLPPVQLMRESGCQIVLGTDSLASNWNLSIWSEILALRKAVPAVGLEEMLRWATLNGARALGISDRVGSFEKGKRPGVVHIDQSQPARIV